MVGTSRILIVEDVRFQAQRLRRLLEREGHEVEVRADAASAEEVVGQGWDLVLADLCLGGDADGLTLFRKVREALGEDAPTYIILTAYGTVEGAREALTAGVYDYLTKPVDPTELSTLVKNALEFHRLQHENRRLSEAVVARRAEERLVGASRAFLDMIEMAKAAAASDATILVRGESGTGKELVAELIHASSPRAKGPLVRVHCGAIPPPLLEAELFGHEQGAFTDAHTARRGRFELAERGTIFLDEIAELGPPLQVKLLRVLQEREVERLGGQGKVIPIDFRLVAATNRDLETMIATGAFREDLYYRINVITVRVPPLRERAGDVDLLVDRFCARFREKNRKPFPGFSAATLERMRQYAWPGNVRELENAVERAVVLGQTEWHPPVHAPGVAPQPARAAGARPAGATPRDLAGGTRADENRADGSLAGETLVGETVAGEILAGQILDASIPLEELGRQLIRRALDRAGGNVTQAARQLGLSRRTLQYRMGRDGILRATV